MLNYDYELSLWNHNDTFIKLLKGENDFPEQAYDVFLKKNISGEASLSFSLPLYIFNYETNFFDENPNWTFIFNEQKIRLIRNKGTLEELVNDFVIRNYTETNSDYLIIINVDCQDYISYELNKVGFKATFSDISTIGITKSTLPPSSPAVNTIWIDDLEVFWRYDGMYFGDHIYGSWILIQDIYNGGLPELE